MPECGWFKPGRTSSPMLMLTFWNSGDALYFTNSPSHSSCRIWQHQAQHPRPLQDPMCPPYTLVHLLTRSIAATSA